MKNNKHQKDSILVNKCGNSYNDINNPCTKLCLPDVGKNISIKVFNLISTINELCHIE